MSLQNQQSAKNQADDLERQRNAAIASYKREISFLKVEAEYERLRTEIEENRLKRLMILNKSIGLHLEQESLRKQAQEESKATEDGVSETKPEEIIETKE